MSTDQNGYGAYLGGVYTLQVSTIIKLVYVANDTSTYMQIIQPRPFKQDGPGYGGVPGCWLSVQAFSSYFYVSQISRQTYI